MNVVMAHVLFMGFLALIAFVSLLIALYFVVQDDVRRRGGV